MRVNEHETEWQPDMTLATLLAAVKPDADIAVVNGFAIDSSCWEETPIAEDDDVVFIQRGEIPAAGDLRALMQARHTPKVADRLMLCRVGIAGAGGLGSHVAQALARIGVGELVIADYDIIEPSNLNRQLYDVGDLGYDKAEVLAKNLKAAAPLTKVKAECRIITSDNVAKIFRGCKVVAECFDRPESKQMLVETVLREMPETSVVAASGIAGTFDPNLIQTRKIRDRFWLVGDEKSAAIPGMGLMAPRVMVAAGHQATTVARILLGEAE